METDRTSVPVGTGGVWGRCTPSEAEKNCNFQSHFAWFGASLLPGVPTQSQVPYFCKKIEGVSAPAVYFYFKLRLQVDQVKRYSAFAVYKWSFDIGKITLK